jgi:quinol-cytochrome oxidoreductase complex cytochrome b subunit
MQGLQIALWHNREHVFSGMLHLVLAVGFIVFAVELTCWFGRQPQRPLHYLCLPYFGIMTLSVVAAFYYERRLWDVIGRHLPHGSLSGSQYGPLWFQLLHGAVSVLQLIVGLWLYFYFSRRVPTHYTAHLARR